MNSIHRHPEHHVALRFCIKASWEIFGAELNSQDTELEQLKKDEESLERMRAIVSPEYWPRVYAMLQKIRDRIRVVEKIIPSNDRKAA